MTIKKGILNFEKSGSLTTNQYKIKVFGSRPGVLHGLCKVHKSITGVCHLDLRFQRFISPSCKPAKFLLLH